MHDLYGEFGTPKYQTASSIYEGLDTVASGEEINILSIMFPDISYEGQDYYYTDKGSDLKEKFEHMSENEDKMWLMDLAVFKLAYGGIDIYGDTHKGIYQIHDIIYNALWNTEMAKRLGFKKLFIDDMLSGNGRHYDEVIETWFDELRDLDRFDRGSMSTAFRDIMKELSLPIYANPYSDFAYHVHNKVMGLRLEKETQLIAECRAFLFSYDDFMYGMRMNQHLYESLEQQFSSQRARLQASYDEQVKRLYMIAEQHGIALPSIEPAALPEADLVMEAYNDEAT